MEEVLKILIVSQYFWPENFTINSLARSLKLKGNDVDILTGKPNYPDGEIFKGYNLWGCNEDIWNGLRLFRIPLLPRGLGSRFRLALNYISFVISGLLFSPFMLKGNKYDVIFVYAPSPITQVIPAIFLKFIFKVPVCLWVQDLWPDSIIATKGTESKFIICLLSWMVKLIYKNVDLVLIPSRGFKKNINKICPTVKVKFYPNSARNIFYVNHKKTNSINKRKFTILFAGNIGEAQSMETIIQAAELLISYNNIIFQIIGSGSKFKWVESKIKKLNLYNIELKERIPENRMPIIMQQASALMVTLKNTDIMRLTIPNKIQSYLASGKPIIGSISGSGAKIINEANVGITCQPENPQALANAVIRMSLTSNAKLVNMGENGRKYFLNNFEHNLLTKKLIKIFISLRSNNYQK